MLGISLAEPREIMKYLGGIFNHTSRLLKLLSVKNIDKESKKDICIDLDFKKGQQQGIRRDRKKGQKIASITQKGKDPNKNCKHCEVDG
jgi:hypothetical protein